MTVQPLLLALLMLSQLSPVAASGSLSPAAFVSSASLRNTGRIAERGGVFGVAAAGRRAPPLSWRPLGAHRRRDGDGGLSSSNEGADGRRRRSAAGGGRRHGRNSRRSAASSSSVDHHHSAGVLGSDVAETPLASGEEEEEELKLRSNGLGNGGGVSSCDLRRLDREQKLLMRRLRLEEIPIASEEDCENDKEGDDAEGEGWMSSFFPGSLGMEDEEEEGEGDAALYASGDELHRLRREVWSLRDELLLARSSGDRDAASKLERQILAAQRRDAEYVYYSSMDRVKQIQEQQQQQKRHKGLLFGHIASQDEDGDEQGDQDEGGNSDDKDKVVDDVGAMMQLEKYKRRVSSAKKALPQFQLEGLWVGKYGDSGFEMINVTYVNDTTMVARKVTTSTDDPNVPCGEVTFVVEFHPQAAADTASEEAGDVGAFGEFLDPIELAPDAAEQWGNKYLYRYGGVGQIASGQYRNKEYVQGQLILVNQQYFSFAWLPIGYQVFFGRPSPSLIVKLLREQEDRERRREQEQISQIVAADDDDDGQVQQQEDLVLQLQDDADSITPAPDVAHFGDKERAYDVARQYLERCMEETEYVLEEERIIEEEEVLGRQQDSQDGDDIYSVTGCFE